MSFYSRSSAQAAAEARLLDAGGDAERKRAAAERERLIRVEAERKRR